MVNALIKLSENANRVLNIVKARFGLKDKGEAIELIINKYSEEENEPELRRAIEKKREIHGKVLNNMKIKEIKSRLKNIFKRHKIVRAGICGSYAKGEQKDNSDIDVLIEIKDKKISLLDLAGLKIELEEAFEKKIDLVEYSKIKPILRDDILKEEIRII